MRSTMRIVLAAAACCAALSAARADTVALAAGGGDGGDGTPAAKARLHEPFGVDFDRQGNLYFVELEGHRVGKIDAKGVFTTLAGTGKKGSAGDGGPGRQAAFNGMHSLAV